MTHHDEDCEPGGKGDHGDDDVDPDDEPFWATDNHEKGWTGRVAFTPRAGGRTVAYRPTDLLVPTARANEAEQWLRSREWSKRFTRDDTDTVGQHTKFRDVPDPIRAVNELRTHTGIVTQPNHVFFLHCGSFCPPHPAWRFAAGYGYAGAYGGRTGFNPAEINPAEINPAEINPAEINPAEINPAEINQFALRRVTGVRRSSARPARPPAPEETAPVAFVDPEVFVLDTGLAKPGTEAPAGLSAPQFFGQKVDVADFDGDQLVDVAAGHGTFIAGVIHHLAPDTHVTVRRVASVFGDVSEFTAARKLWRIPGSPHTLLNLSFGGYAFDDEAAVLAEAIADFQDKGGVVVASAGNDGSCCPTYPAALPGVVSVGALGPSGPASFTNYGPWVRACAPGVALLNMFFNYNGKMAAGGGVPDPDDYTGCAFWSGTSFAGPVVVGALARTMLFERITAQQAVARLIDAPELFRFPDLGTVVNVI